MNNFKDRISKLSQDPGVYKFLDKDGVVLYVGRATNLRSRVRQYFGGHDSRGTVDLMLPLIEDIEIIETDSVLEALILEANLIKKHLPKYNMMGKDDKSFAYFVITSEEFPRVLIIRETDLRNLSNDTTSVKASAGRDFRFSISTKTSRQSAIVNRKYLYGPYLSKYQMEIALKIMRKIFPIHQKAQKTEKGCLDFQIGLCPGPYSGEISKEDYRKNIRNIRYILEGKKKRLITTLEKEMRELARNHEFEKAGEIKNKIFALQHIHDIALINRESSKSEILDDPELENLKFKIQNFRIEGYDISNISGQHSVGSMVVFDAEGPVKSQYRKFKIKTIEGADDVNSMKEVLARRFHNDWPMPDLVVLDGGQGHLNMARELIESLRLDIPLVAISKGQTRKNFEFRISPAKGWSASGGNLSSKKFLDEMMKKKNFLIQLMNEAHRFAITYHRKIRNNKLTGE